MRCRKAGIVIFVIACLFICGSLGFGLGRRYTEDGYYIHAEENKPRLRAQEAEIPAAPLPDFYVDGRLDLNAADAAALIELPGIGEALADRIIEYRAVLGAFTDTRQLIEVSGIGPETYAKLENYVTIGGQG